MIKYDTSSAKIGPPNLKIKPHLDFSEQYAFFHLELNELNSCDCEYFMIGFFKELIIIKCM